MRTSIMNNKNALAEAVANASSMKEAIENLGLRAAGGNYKSLREACRRHNIDLPQFDRKKQLAEAMTSRLKTNEYVFVENSEYHNRTHIKKRMFAMGIPNICDECGQKPVWNGKPLVLTLEHINGVWNDNRLENLRILCGHCHSQTATFCGGNK